MSSMLQDLRYALRQLARSPGFTIVAVLTLALGAGTNSLLFSVIHAVLLRHRLWQTRFGADPAIVGRTVIMDEEPVTVVGVLPATFDFPRGATFWRPLSRLPTNGGKTWTTLFVRVVGRLAPGFTITQARAELSGLLPRSRFQPPFVRDAAVDVVSLHERLYGSTRPLLLILLGAVGFVLLIACANVASLLVARAARREREFAIRAALGGGRLRLARQLLAESMVLAILGAAAGLVVPALGLPLFMHAAPLRAVEAVDVHLNTAVLAFTTGLALLTGVAFGLAPALTASRPNLVVGLKSGAGQAGTAAHRARLRSGLVVAELAAALVLLMGAGLLARSLLQLLAVDLGFRADHVVGVRMGRLSKSWFLQGHARSEFYGAVRERLAALPGVASVALTDVLPLGGIARSSTVRVDDAPPGSVDVSLRAVSADYFKAVEATVIAGRDFTLADRSDAAPVAVVNAAFARELLHGSDPVGHQVWAGGPSRTIVGEVKDVPQLARDGAR